MYWRRLHVGEIFLSGNKENKINKQVIVHMLNYIVNYHDIFQSANQETQLCFTSASYLDILLKLDSACKLAT
jgi:hypothetical protein